MLQQLKPIDLSKLRVYPLAQRRRHSRIEEVLVEPANPPKPCKAPVSRIILDCATKIRAALERNICRREKGNGAARGEAADGSARNPRWPWRTGSVLGQ